MFLSSSTSAIVAIYHLPNISRAEELYRYPWQSARCAQDILKSPVPSPKAASDELDLQDLVGARSPGRCDFHGIPLRLTDQRPGDRRGDRYAAVLGIRLEVAHDLVFLLRARVLVDERHGGAEGNGTAGQLRNINHFRSAELIFQFDDASLDKGLTIFGRVIFGVFGEITVRAGFLDETYGGRPLYGFQMIDLVFEGRVARGRHGDAFHVFSPCLRQKKLLQACFGSGPVEVDSFALNAFCDSAIPN